MDLRAKSALLDSVLRECGSLLVAYSGGTDSAFLAYAAHRALGDQMLAVIADSASLPREELRLALAFTTERAIPTQVLQTTEIVSADYRRNDANRCFHCKDELFSRMEALRAQLNYAHLAFGMNTDDRGEHRPGQTAAASYGVLSPLVTAQLSKAEIRQLAHEAGLSLHAKPASACLSSRIAYGLPVTAERLAQIEQAEAFLHELGFLQVRVRHHDVLARVEIDRDDLARALNVTTFQTISRALKVIGFTFVAIDAEGYRSGSMNAILPVAAITPALHG